MVKVHEHVVLVDSMHHAVLTCIINNTVLLQMVHTISSADGCSATCICTECNTIDSSPVLW